MNILGISCFYHDAAAALLQDGQLVAAAEEERFSRRKHDARFPDLAIEFCLRSGGIRGEDLDYVVFYEKPIAKLDRLLTTAMAGYGRSWQAFRRAMRAECGEKLWIKSRIVERLRVPAKRVLFVDHHDSHAASAVFCSPFRETAVLTVDGVGEWSTTAVGTGRGDWDGTGVNTLSLDQELAFPHSLGLLYAAFTAFLGFEVNEGEYKVMGMAPYGTPRYEDKVYKLLQAGHDGSFQLNMEYFSYHHSPTRAFSDRFVDLFGPPRQPESEFITRTTHDVPDASDAVLERNQYYADVAASIQKVTEDLLVRMAIHARQSTGMTNLCVAGGVAMNSVANGRLLREASFEDLYIQPSPGDAGGAVGAALYAWHVLLGKRRTFVMEHAYWGRRYTPSEVRAFLRREAIPYEEFEDDDRLLESVTGEMARGKVVGWFQGGFEWGPRALGNRSILADPRSAAMKDVVNSKIKFREPFRPFAPVVLEQHAANYFQGLSAASAARLYPLRFMLMVLPWLDGPGASVPATNHRGTGRLQTVRREWHPRFYGLIERFGEVTGTPVLMNTSFNLRGEPIVGSPEDAFKTFTASGIDLLVMENFVVRKAQHV